MKKKRLKKFWISNGNGFNDLPTYFSILKIRKQFSADKRLSEGYQQKFDFITLLNKLGIKRTKRI